MHRCGWFLRCIGVRHIHQGNHITLHGGGETKTIHLEELIELGILCSNREITAGKIGEAALHWYRKITRAHAEPILRGIKAEIIQLEVNGNKCTEILWTSTNGVSQSPQNSTKEVH